MAQKPIRPNAPRANARLRPGQDMVVAKQQANSFPSIGMALPNYKYDPKDRHKRVDHTEVIKPGLWSRFKGWFTLKHVVLSLLALMVIGGAFLGYKFIYNAHKVFGGSIFSVLGNTKLKGEDQGRVNILLAGNSADDAGHNGANLTDSIMLISIDTKNNKAFLLSIPRDLWVKIDGSGHQKINEAYVTGTEEGFKESGYPEGGMGQLEQVVSKSLGVPIHYYALVNYNALKQGVDAVGGIDYTVKSSDPRGLYDPNIDWTTKGPLVKLTNGTHHLTGQQALDLARARGDAYNSYGFAASDFDRTKHQRELIVALKSKLSTPGVIANPAKLSSLFDVVGKNVKTDMKLNEVHRLFDLSKKIDNSKVASLSLNDNNGKDLLASYLSPNGQSALIPAAGLDNFYDIQLFMKRQTSSNPVVQEGAKIVVLNSTTTNGLATKVKQQLQSSNFAVTQVGDAKTPQATTTVIDASNNKKPATKAALIKKYGSNNVTTVNPYAGVYNADFIIIVGNDQIPQSTSTSN